MELAGVSLIDWLIIGVYLVGITILGVWMAKKVKDAASFFIGDRKFGKIMMIFFMFGAGTHSDQAVSVASKTYRAGVSGIWYQWLWLFPTPFFWLIAPIFRRMRAVTTGDYYEARYGQSVSVLYAAAGIMQLMVGIGVMLKGTGAMVTAVSGGVIDPNIAIVVMTVMFVIYGMAGGMSAAIATNFVQGILTIVLSFLILPFALMEVGGMSGLRESLSPAMLEIVAPGEITGFFIAVIAFNALIGWVTQPHSMANSAAGKTEMEGRVGVTAGLFTKRICTIAWMLTGLCAVAMYADKGLEDVDHAYGAMAHYLLPKGLEIFWKVSAMMGIAFWVALFWRGATVAGAWAGTLASFATLLFTSKITFGDFVLWNFNDHFVEYLPGFMVWEDKLYLPWQMILYLSIGFISLVVVSLFTRRVPKEKLDRIYNCLRTPIAAGEPELGPFTLPSDVEPGPRKVLVKHPDFEIPRPSLVGIVGFLASWAVVGLLIWIVYWLVGA